MVREVAHITHREISTHNTQITCEFARACVYEYVRKFAYACVFVGVASWHKFSQVSSVVLVYGEFSSELAFQKFYKRMCTEKLNGKLIEFLISQCYTCFR